jgi:hypothetical protein
MQWPYFLLPVVPAVSRLGLCVRFRGLLHDGIPDDWLNTDQNLVVLIGIAGFSFTGVVGITVLESATRRQELQLPIFFLLVSFLCSLSGINLESYRFDVFRFLAGDILYDASIFCLIASIVTIVIMARYPLSFMLFVTLIAFAAWSGDHLLRVRYTNHVLVGVKHAKKEQEEEGRVNQRPGGA